MGQGVRVQQQQRHLQHCRGDLCSQDVRSWALVFPGTLLAASATAPSSGR